MTVATIDRVHVDANEIDRMLTIAGREISAEHDGTLQDARRAYDALEAALVDGEKLDAEEIKSALEDVHTALDLLQAFLILGQDDYDDGEAEQRVGRQIANKLCSAESTVAELEAALKQALDAMMALRATGPAAITEDMDARGNIFVGIDRGPADRALKCALHEIGERVAPLVGNVDAMRDVLYRAAGEENVGDANEREEVLNRAFDGIDINGFTWRA
jgi:hypothetical protein